MQRNTILNTHTHTECAEKEGGGEPEMEHVVVFHSCSIVTSVSAAAAGALTCGGYNPLKSEPCRIQKKLSR